MTTAEFQFFAALIHQKSGINLGELKYELLRARMAKRLRALKIGSFAEYRQFLDADRNGMELERLVDVVTTNKTDFFREAKHFEHLTATVVPDYLASASAKKGRPLRVWSAACSSGEEPYTLAMVLTEALQDRAPFKILATDISSRMLHRAAAAVYSPEKMQGVGAGMREKYFETGTRDGEKSYVVKPGLRSSVTFSRFNLNEGSNYVFENGFDAIFCRNVMIYFDRTTQEAVVGHLARHILPGGYLYTGFSESLIGIKHPLKASGASVYRQPGA